MPPAARPVEGQIDSGALHGIPVESIRAELQRILASETFAHSERLCRFLQFTVETALSGAGASLKEYLIGTQVFDKKESYDPRIDPIVRVEAGRLRSKLEEFYTGEGRNNSTRITFHKGSYVPVFLRHDAPPVQIGLLRQRLAGLRQARNVPLLALMAACLTAFVWCAILFRDNRALRTQLRATGADPAEPELSLFWNPFFAPGVRNVVVFGSPVFFSSDNGGLFLRWKGLNESSQTAGDAQYRKMEKLFRPLFGPRYDYALMADAIALQRLTAFFGHAGGSLVALPAHSASWENLQDANTIFLGAARMMPLLSRLPVRKDFEWDAEFNVVNRNPRPGEQQKYVTSSHFDETSYAIVALFPGLQPDRRILLLTAHSGPGIRAALDHVTKPQLVRELVQKIGLHRSGGLKYYEVLLRVVVDKGDRVKSEYVTHHLVSPAGKW